MVNFLAKNQCQCCDLKCQCPPNLHFEPCSQAEEPLEGGNLDERGGHRKWVPGEWCS